MIGIAGLNVTLRLQTRSCKICTEQCRPDTDVADIKHRLGRNDGIWKRSSVLTDDSAVRHRSEMDAGTAETEDDSRTSLQLDLVDTGSYVSQFVLGLFIDGLWGNNIPFRLGQIQLCAAAGAPVIEVELKWGASINSAIYGYGSRLEHQLNRPSKLTQQQIHKLRNRIR